MSLSPGQLTASISSSNNASIEEKCDEYFLPTELWRMVAEHLDYHSLTKFRRVKKAFRSIVQAHDFDDAMFRLPLPKEEIFMPSSGSNVHDPADINMLMAMGFSQVRSVKGLRHTTSVEAAANWIFEHANDADIDEPMSEENCTASMDLVDLDQMQALVHFIVKRREGQLPLELLPAAVHELHPILVDITSWKDIEAPSIFSELLADNLGAKEAFEAWTLWDMVMLENLASVSGPIGEVLLAKMHRLYATQDAIANEKSNNILLGQLLYALKEHAIVPPLPEWRSVHIKYEKEDEDESPCLDLIEGDESTVGDFLRVMLEHGIIQNSAHWESSQTGSFRGFKLEDTHRASMLYLVPKIEQIDGESGSEESEDEVSDDEDDM